MIRIEPLGTGVIVPAIVVGYEIVSGEQEHTVEHFGESPNWILTLDQQAGGYSMSYPSVVGAVLRLADNPEHCLGDLRHVVRGFRAMAEEPDVKLLAKEYPVLQQLVHTFGGDYTGGQLRRLTGFLGQFFKLPGFVSGREAFVRFEQCDVAGIFEGWRALRIASVGDLFPLSENNGAIHVDDSSIRSLTIAADVVMDSSKLAELEAVGARLRADGPRAFFLWENSD